MREETDREAFCEGAKATAELTIAARTAAVFMVTKRRCKMCLASRYLEGFAFNFQHNYLKDSISQLLLRFSQLKLDLVATLIQYDRDSDFVFYFLMRQQSTRWETLLKEASVSVSLEEPHLT